MFRKQHICMFLESQHKADTWTSIRSVPGAYLQQLQLPMLRLRLHLRLRWLRLLRLCLLLRQMKPRLSSVATCGTSYGCR